jgi:hypothetical protein
MIAVSKFRQFIKDCNNYSISAKREGKVPNPKK